MKKGISFVHQNPTCFAHTVDASLNNLWQFLCFLLFLFLNKKSQELTRENSYTVHFREPQPTLLRDEIKCSIIMRRPFTFTLHSSARFVWPVCRQCMFFGERKVKNASGFRFKPKCNLTFEIRYLLRKKVAFFFTHLWFQKGLMLNVFAVCFFNEINFIWFILVVKIFFRRFNVIYMVSTYKLHVVCSIEDKLTAFITVIISNIYQSNL